MNYIELNKCLNTLTDGFESALFMKGDESDTEKVENIANWLVLASKSTQVVMIGLVAYVVHLRYLQPKVGKDDEVAKCLALEEYDTVLKHVNEGRALTHDTLRALETFIQMKADREDKDFASTVKDGMDDFLRGLKGKDSSDG